MAGSEGKASLESVLEGRQFGAAGIVSSGKVDEPSRRKGR